MITKKCLRTIIGGTQYNYHLQTTATSYGSHLRVRAGGQDLYVPTTVLTVGTGLRVIGANGTTYKAVDLTPHVWVDYKVYYDSKPYVYPYYWDYINIHLWEAVTINNAVYLQMESSNNGWYDVSYLPANSTGTAMKNSYRTYSTRFRIRINSWYSSVYDVGYSTGTKNIAIPEAQWGV